jgi:adenylate cyclase
MDATVNGLAHLATPIVVTPHLGSADMGTELRDQTFKRWVWGAAVVSAGGGGIVGTFLAFAAPIVLTPADTQRLLIRGGTVLIVFLAIAVPVRGQHGLAQRGAPTHRGGTAGHAGRLR